MLVASWIPFEGPEGGPNYFEWGKGVTYNINVDSDGDAVADYTYSLTSEIDTQNPLTFLYSVGNITANIGNWNRQQRITITETSADGQTTLLDNVLTAPVNIGNKSTPNYETLEDDFIYDVNDGGDDLTIYAGQTDDAFWVDLQVFDLLTLRGQPAPIGYETGNNIPVDSLSGFKQPQHRDRAANQPHHERGRAGHRRVGHGGAQLHARAHAGRHCGRGRQGASVASRYAAGQRSGAALRAQGCL